MFFRCAILVCAICFSANAENCLQPEIRRKAELAELRKRTFEEWVRDVTDKNPAIRLKATHAVGVLASFPGEKGLPENAVPTLALALRDTDTAVAAEAAIQIGGIIHWMLYGLSYVNLGEIDLKSQYGPWEKSRRESITTIATATVPTLIELLSNKDISVRRNAVWALGYMLTDSKAVVPNLSAMLKDPDMETRRRACYGLRQFSWIRGPRNVDAAYPALLDAFKNDKDQSVRVAAFDALIRLQPPRDTLIEALKAALQDVPAGAEYQYRRDKLTADLEAAMKMKLP